MSVNGERLMARMKEASRMQKELLQEIHDNIRKMENAKKELRNRSTEVKCLTSCLTSLNNAQ